MASAEPITDHDEIRRWAEDNDGRPAVVKGTASDDSPGVLRIDFQDKDDALEEISWDDWFAAFDRAKLALLADKETRFNKLIDRPN